MYLIRPAIFSDLTSIERLLSETEARVTTLPKDRDQLSERISESSDAFLNAADNEQPASYLFVMEDTKSGELHGTSGIDSEAGNGYPFFNYRLDKLVHASHALNISSKVPVLFLSHELTGKTLMRSFAIDPALHDSEYFDLLSRARLMFMATQAGKFHQEIIVEIQGIFNDKGDCPFWDAVGRKFIDLDFLTVDYYCSKKSKTFMSELIPQHPIYVPLLPPKAAENIGRSHQAANRICQLLYKEGFQQSKFIDPFDGGPVLKCEVKFTQTYRNMRFKKAYPSEVADGMKYLISNHRHDDFRCVVGTLVEGIGDSVRISHEVAEALNVEQGDSLAFSLL
ncbi:arginine N-succinyltransferase [Reinekea thalattae]|uniref:Arginine N-succinyltransferase n=1 Tax=Reinekea thalattae TaxID=2593301 RepID=A0A5C8Z2E6_9GAMM|nr:arginine N-succinyltransferase [Reinekea thalattae]TXR51383.1 arginine N-succinyltransferase [Reinekea thalattae]